MTKRRRLSPPFDQEVQPYLLDISFPFRDQVACPPYLFPLLHRPPPIIKSYICRFQPVVHGCTVTSYKWTSHFPFSFSSTLPLAAMLLCVYLFHRSTPSLNRRSIARACSNFLSPFRKHWPRASHLVHQLPFTPPIGASLCRWTLFWKALPFCGPPLPPHDHL